MKKKIIIGALGLLVVTTGAVAMVKMQGESQNYYNSSRATEDEKDMYSMGKDEKERLGTGGEYDPTQTTREQIREKAESVADQMGKTVDEAEEIILQNALEEKALYLAAIEVGINVTDSEVDQAVNDIRTAVHDEEEEEKQLKAVIAGRGMSEDEYWNSLKAQYKVNMMINKYLEGEYEKMADKENVTKEEENYSEKTATWRKILTDEAIDKFDVKIN